MMNDRQRVEAAIEVPAEIEAILLAEVRRDIASKGLEGTFGESVHWLRDVHRMAHNLAVEDATDEERLEVVAEDYKSMYGAHATTSASTPSAGTIAWR